MPGSELGIFSFMSWRPSIRHRHSLRLAFEVVICDVSIISWSHYKCNKLERPDVGRLLPWVPAATARSRKKVGCPGIAGKLPQFGLC